MPDISKQIVESFNRIVEELIKELRVNIWHRDIFFGVLFFASLRQNMSTRAVHLSDNREPWVIGYRVCYADIR